MTIFQEAVTDHTGFMWLQTGGSTGKSRGLGISSSNEPTRFKKNDFVGCVDLDNRVRYGIIPRPDVVLIDVEGGELKVLDGMKNIRPQHILIEIHTGMGVSLEAATIKLQKMGYKNIPKYQTRRGNEYLCHFILESGLT